jgi:LL-H family phage holin
MREITLEALKLLIMVTVLVLTRFVVPWLKAKTSNETMQAVLDWTMQAVLAAEQAHQAQTGAERKYIVTKFIKQILIQKNISLSDEELNTLIEAAVMQMNANK